jgi:hypothetical protein
VTPSREPADGNPRKLAAVALACIAGVALVAFVVYNALHKTAPTIDKVTIRSRDDVYYTHAATSADAEALGRTLRSLGFFKDSGAAVLLSKGTGGTIVNFILNDGAWDHAATVFGFEEIGRRVAPVVGGYPIHLRLCDSKWGVHKEVIVGKIMAGARDEIYYYGSATEAEAQALADALKRAAYLVDSGSSVILSKDGATSMGFVVADGAWLRLSNVVDFQLLVRKVASSVGGLPISLRLLNSDMEVKREVPVQ